MIRGVPVALVVLALAASVAADNKRIAVRVVDVAGGVAYVAPGEEAGLQVGQRVRFGKRVFRIAAVTRDHATVSLKKRSLDIGDKGSARVQKQRTHGPKGLERALPLASYRQQWPEAKKPADSQNPKPVPIAGIRPRGNTEVVLIAQGRSFLPADEGRHVTRASLRAQLRTEPFGDIPFGIDADAAVSRWFGSRVDDDLGADSRPIVRVNELRLRYGDRDNPRVGLGRLRYAAAGVGLLDGVRVVSPAYAGISVAAFGGLVPNSLDGIPDSDVSRFGVSASLVRPDLAAQPAASVTAFGSVFDGAVDERRLAAEVRVFPGPTSISAHTEVSMFDSDNEWGANRVELTAAGVDAGLRLGLWRVAASFTAQQPERSRWLASLLPSSWLCTARVTDSEAEPCNGDKNLRYSTLFAITRAASRLTLRLGATSVFASGLDRQQVGGFADVHIRRLPLNSSFELGATASRADFVDNAGVRLGYSVPVLSVLDLGAYYRPAMISYRAADASFLEHRAGLDAFMTPMPALSLHLVAEGVQGEDITALGLFGTAVWRPL